MPTPRHASAALDAEIAEKVFGFLEIEKIDNGERYIYRSDPTYNFKIPVPSYSSGTTLTDACGLIVEAMEKRGWMFSITNNMVKFWKPMSQQVFSSEAENLPERICLAALAALNAETKKEGV